MPDFGDTTDKMAINQLKKQLLWNRFIESEIMKTQLRKQYNATRVVPEQKECN